MSNKTLHSLIRIIVRVVCIFDAVLNVETMYVRASRVKARSYAFLLSAIDWFALFCLIAIK